MQRNLWSLTFAAAMVAAAWLPSPVSRSDANAGPYYGTFNSGYYSRGGYAPGYGGYGGHSGYGYSPYGNGGYTYVAPRVYAYPSYRSYRSYNYSPGIGTAGTYGGMIEQRYGGSRMYGQPYRPAYTPYGYGGYGPYGY